MKIQLSQLDMPFEYFTEQCYLLLQLKHHYLVSLKLYFIICNLAIVNSFHVYCQSCTFYSEKINITSSEEAADFARFSIRPKIIICTSTIYMFSTSYMTFSALKTRQICGKKLYFNKLFCFLGGNIKSLEDNRI